MKANEVDKRIFTEYAKRHITELSLLLDFKLPKEESWELDWIKCQDVSRVNQQKKASTIPFFDRLFNFSGSPAIYYFTVEQDYAKALFDAFLLAKQTSSTIKREKGLRDKEFYSISHVPKSFKKGDCIYVGSTKTDIYGRLIQHLGLTSSGRTGALYLNQVLSSFEKKPKIKFHCYILDKKYVNVTEHIESVMQDSLDPFIGKRALKKFSS
jgi:hypothetical protein